jgi:hypothetical protein
VRTTPGARGRKPASSRTAIKAPRVMCPVAPIHTTVNEWRSSGHGYDLDIRQVQSGHRSAGRTTQHTRDRAVCRRVDDDTIASPTTVSPFLGASAVDGPPPGANADDAVRRQTLFAAATHDLNTPLTSLTLWIDTLRGRRTTVRAKRHGMGKPRNRRPPRAGQPDRSTGVGARLQAGRTGSGAPRLATRPPVRWGRARPAPLPPRCTRVWHGQLTGL